MEMSKYEQKDNTFSAFKNQRKETDNHPELTGTLIVGGKHHWMNVWLKKDKNGNLYISGSVKEKEAEYAKAKEAVQNTPDPSDEIPF
jgi:hypothetical protein